MYPNSQFDLTNPEGFSLFYRQVTTYHWLVTALENRGIPQKIIDKFRSIEPILAVKAFSSPYYQTLSQQICQEVAQNFCDEKPPALKHQEHRWVICTQNPQNYQDISRYYRAISTAIEVFTNFGVEPDDMNPIVVGSMEFLNFMAAEFINLAEELTGQSAAKYG